MVKANLMERRRTSDLFIDYKNIYDNVKNAQHVYLIAISEHYYDKVKYMSLYTMPTPIKDHILRRTAFNNMGKLFK